MGTTMHKHVLVVTPLIAPGGGPPGYVYNLMRGIEELSEAGELKNKFEFFGRLSKKRYKATGDGFRPRSILSSIVQFLSKWGLNPPRSRRIANARKAIENADVVVYQGYQDAQLVIYAHVRGTHTVYMPHSPSIMADEVEMVCRLNNRVLEKSSIIESVTTRRNSLATLTQWHFHLRVLRHTTNPPFRNY